MDREQQSSVRVVLTDVNAAVVAAWRSMVSRC